MSEIKELEQLITPQFTAVSANVRLCKAAIAEQLGDANGEVEGEARMMQIYLEAVEEKSGELFESFSVAIDRFSKLEADTVESRGAGAKVTKLESEVNLLRGRSTNASQALIKERGNALRLQEEVDELKLALTEATKGLENAEKIIESNKPKLGELEALKKLNPVELKSQLEEQEKKFAKRVESLEKRLENAESRASKAASSGKSESESKEVFGKRLIHKMPGLHGIDYRLSLYNHASEFAMKPIDDIVPLLRGMQWHLRINSTDGLSADVSVNECIVPIFPYSSEMKETWPKKLTDEIQSHLLTLVKETNPELLALRKAASNLFLTTHPKLVDSERDALKKIKVITMLDVSGRSKEDLREKILKTNKLSHQGFEVLYKKLQEVYKSFSKENGVARAA
ncbi:hypothetical protein [Vibrio owensii]|uniref:hypothetical protein n=1 Tax=Vibrio owensii TaxID=696485 RepID=UPI0018F1CAA5|nr:hypothetical protein [Vibrio owensii]